MRIAIFGLGYVGTTAAACLARDGHRVLGVDSNPVKAIALAEGRVPFAEPGLEGLIGQAITAGRLSVTQDAAAAIEAADCSMICVGTPARPNGWLDLDALLGLVSEIALLMKAKRVRHTLIVRSTIPPGTIEKLIIPTIERASGMVAGRDYGLSFYPEFLREGSAIADHDSPGTLVYSASDDATAELLTELVRTSAAPALRVGHRTAEAIKLLNNAWHATKVSFANEMGLILKAAGVDSHAVFSVLTEDTKLNMAPAYLTPAFAFGGSCLPKDLSALRRIGLDHGLHTPLIDGVLSANQRQIEEAVRLVQASGARSIALIGISFKAGTDDLRHSPYVELAARLVTLGFRPRIFDRAIDPSRLHGANSDYVEKRLPALEQLLSSDIDSALEGCDTLIIADRGQAEAHIDAIARHRPAIIDLVRSEPIAKLGLRYAGICW